MIVNIQSKRMVVMSDLHLGNPYCKTKQSVLAFIREAVAAGWDVCINGDGLEIAQVSFRRWARDVPEVMQALRELVGKGARLYYVVGNHDMALEHFLNDWGLFSVCPFLNVVCGEQRIRVEHGHLYDPVFVRSPELYDLMTRAAGVVLRAAPRAYEAWMALEKLAWHRKQQKAGDGISGEAPHFEDAAREIARRGFDSVVFGHTHHVGSVDLGGGATYLNPGSWLIGRHYVSITESGTALQEWVPGSLAEA